MNAPELIAELNSRGVRLTVCGNRLRYDAPAGVMTSDLAERMKACKPELLALLANSRPANVERLETYADREVRRFFMVCRSWPDGRGWYDPAFASIIEALARVYDRSKTSPRMTGSPPKLYERPNGSVETFTERSVRYLRDCSGLSPGVSRKNNGACF